MPIRNVDLTEHFDEFISSAVEAGRYSNASDAVRAGLRLLEQQEQEDKAKIEWLRTATQDAFEALDRGEGIQLSSADNIDAFVKEIVEENENRTHWNTCLAAVVQSSCGNPKRHSRHHPLE